MDNRVTTRSYVSNGPGACPACRSEAEPVAKTTEPARSSAGVGAVPDTGSAASGTPRDCSATGGREPKPLALLTFGALIVGLPIAAGLTSGLVAGVVTFFAMGALASRFSEMHSPPKVCSKA